MRSSRVASSLLVVVLTLLAGIWSARDTSASVVDQAPILLDSMDDKHGDPEPEAGSGLRGPVHRGRIGDHPFFRSDHP